MRTMTLLRESNPILRIVSRWAMGAAGVLWVALAASLCGCSPISPVNGWVMNESGQAFYKRGEYRAARQEFERALMDRPESADYAFNVAAAMDREGDKLAAEKMYRHALTLDPSHQPSYHGLAAMMNETGRSTEANELITTWAATQPYMSEPYVELGWLKEEQGDLEAADQALTKALRNNPRHSKALAQLGQTKGRRGRKDEAAAEYARSLFMDPNQPGVRQQMSSLGYDASMSPALQMAGSMPQYDASMMGGFPAGSDSQAQPMNGYPMPQQAPMMSQQTLPTYGSQATYPTWDSPQNSAPMNYSPTTYAPRAPMMPAPMMSSPIPTQTGMVYPGAVPLGDPLASTYMTGTSPYGQASYSTMQPMTSYYQPQPTGMNDAPNWTPAYATPAVDPQPTLNASYGGSTPIQTSTVPVVPAF